MKRTKRLVSTLLPLVSQGWNILNVKAVAPTTTDYTVYPGKDDISYFNSTSGLYQKSVTLIARMYTTNDHKPASIAPNKSFWGLPSIIWLILIGFTIILIVILATLFFCCWLLPKQRKLFSPTNFKSHKSVSLHSILPQKTTTNSTTSTQSSQMAHVPPPKYTAPPPPKRPQIPTDSKMSMYHQQHYQQQRQQQHHHYIQSPPMNYDMNYDRRNSNSHQINYQLHQYQLQQQQQQQQQQKQHHPQQCNNHFQQQVQPAVHKSCWALDQNNGTNEPSTSSSMESASYRTRSLPSRNKQRPASTADDLEELYAKVSEVNFSKKRRNRMRNDDAAIIALCRSRSQNLSSEATIIYDERTNL